MTARSNVSWYTARWVAAVTSIRYRPNLLFSDSFLSIGQASDSTHALIIYHYRHRRKALSVLSKIRMPEKAACPDLGQLRRKISPLNFPDIPRRLFKDYPLKGKLRPGCGLRDAVWWKSRCPEDNKAPNSNRIPHKIEKSFSKNSKRNLSLKKKIKLRLLTWYTARWDIWLIESSVNKLISARFHNRLTATAGLQYQLVDC